MKRWLLEYLPATLLLTIIGLIVLHAPISVWMGTVLPEYAREVKVWKEVLMMIAAIPIAAGIIRRGLWGKFVKNPVVWLIIGSIVLHVALAIIEHVPLLAAIAGLIIDLRYGAFFLLVYGFLYCHPQYRKWFIRVAIAGAVVVTSVAVLQLFLPHDVLKYLGYSRDTIAPYMTVDENYDFIRINSTLRGPNPLGAYAVIVLSGVFALGVRWRRAWTHHRVRYLHVWVAIGGAIALWNSYSRSAWIGAVLAAGVIFVIAFGRRLTARTITILIMGAVLLALAIGVLWQTPFMKNVILHDDPTTGAEIDSNEAHIDSLTHGTLAVLAKPFGSGIGSTGSASIYTDKPVIIENHYLMIAHEAGWLGLILFVSVYGLILSRLYARRSDWLALALLASGVGLAFIGVLLPVWADDVVSLIWWGMAAVALTKGVEYGRTTNQKTARAT